MNQRLERAAFARHSAVASGGDSLRLPVLALELEQSTLPWQPEGEPAQTLRGHDTMTWDGEQQPVGATSRADRTGRARRTDLAGDLRIRPHVPGGNLAKRAPDSLLECRAVGQVDPVTRNLGVEPNQRHRIEIPGKSTPRKADAMQCVTLDFEGHLQRSKTQLFPIQNDSKRVEGKQEYQKRGQQDA